jgi:hypothetical protein
MPSNARAAALEDGAASRLPSFLRGSLCGSALAVLLLCVPSLVGADATHSLHPPLHPIPPNPNLTHARPHTQLRSLRFAKVRAPRRRHCSRSVRAHIRGSGCRGPWAGSRIPSSRSLHCVD